MAPSLDFEVYIHVFIHREVIRRKYNVIGSLLQHFFQNDRNHKADMKYEPCHLESWFWSTPCLPKEIITIAGYIIFFAIDE